MKKPRKILFNVSEVNTGEYFELYKHVKDTETYNPEKFIKFYFHVIDLLDVFTKPELTIIKYICQNIKIKKKTIILTHIDTNLTKSAFYRAVSGLINHKVISKTKYTNLYLINKSTIYNGKG